MGLTFLINTEAFQAAAPAGSLAMGGDHNTYYCSIRSDMWRGAMTQILPFADPIVLDLLDRFEREGTRRFEGGKQIKTSRAANRGRHRAEAPAWGAKLVRLLVAEGCNVSM